MQNHIMYTLLLLFREKQIRAGLFPSRTSDDIFHIIPDDYARSNFNHYSTGEQYCGGRLDKPSGTFKTPNWPEKDYPAGVTCSWHIVAPKNQVRGLR